RQQLRVPQGGQGVRTKRVAFEGDVIEGRARLGGGSSGDKEVEPGAEAQFQDPGAPAGAKQVKDARRLQEHMARFCQGAATRAVRLTIPAALQRERTVEGR